MVEQRVESKREQLRKAREQQAKEAKIRKVIGLSLAGLLVAALITGAVLIFMNRPASGPQEDLIPKYVTAEGSFHILPSGEVDTTAGQTSKEGQTRVEMVLDLQCPGCGSVSRTLDSQLLELAKKGEVDLYFKPVSFLDRTSTDRYSSRAGNALVTVASEAPTHFYEFMSLLYKEGVQPGEGPNYKPVTDERLGELAKQVGVPQEVANRFKDHLYMSWLLSETEKTAVRQDLFPNESFSTPALFVGGKVEGAQVTGAKRVAFTANEPIQTSFEAALKAAKAGK